MASLPTGSPLLLLLLLLSASAFSTATARSPPKHHHLCLYVHNVTAVFAASLNNPRHFGDLVVFDNVLREGPEPNSPLVGAMQGLGVSDDMTDVTSSTMFNLVFTGGKYNGSSIAGLGLFQSVGVSEYTIVGGSGKFRLASGYLLNIPVNSTTTLTTKIDAHIAFH
ncbi:dirigent protein 1-like [Curcuma longa]|uniref:dirigent protein 1-like n=1 Tax=Curcuma longa TaxID=136217 RepID=UPI003D9DD256